jgi:hypothetical protein
VPCNLRQARTIPRQAPDHRGHLVRPYAGSRAASRPEIIRGGGHARGCRRRKCASSPSRRRARSPERFTARATPRSGHRSTGGIGRVPALTLMVGRPPRQRQMRTFRSRWGCGALARCLAGVIGAVAWCASAVAS